MNADPRRTGRPKAAPKPPPAYVGEELQAINCDAGVLWIPTSDGVMRPFLERRGTWEQAEGKLLLSLASPGVRFADIGANVGYFSLLIAKSFPGAHIHAFEPHPLTSQVLALNAWNSDADITVHAVALSAGPRLLALDTGANNLGDTRSRVRDTATSLAPGTTMDRLLPEAVFDLVKIDVQGFEPDVVSGMADVIGRSPDIVIVSEFWPTALRERDLDPADALAVFAGMGLDTRVQVDENLTDLTPSETVSMCDQAGPNGQVNLVMTKR